MALQLPSVPQLAVELLTSHEGANIKSSHASVRLSPSGATEEHWREIRAIVLARDNGRCKECGELCAQGEADIHHLVPRAAGGMDEPANLITLCDGCHAARHPRGARSQ